MLRLGLSENHMSVAITNNNMGIVLNKLGKYPEAMEKYWESLRVKKLKLMKDHANLAGTLHNMGVVHRNKKEYEMALACYEEALRIRRKRLGLKNAHSAATLQNMGVVYRDMKQFQKAMQFLEDALDMNRLILGGDSIEVANIINDLGKVHADMGNHDRAMKYYDEARYILDNASISKEHVYFRENDKFVKESKLALGLIEEDKKEGEQKADTDTDNESEGSNTKEDFEAKIETSDVEGYKSNHVEMGDLLDLGDSGREDSSRPMMRSSVDEDALIQFLTPIVSTQNDHISSDEPLLSFHEPDGKGDDSLKEDTAACFTPKAMPRVPPPCPPTTPAVAPKKNSDVEKEEVSGGIPDLSLSDSLKTSTEN